MPDLGGWYRHYNRNTGSLDADRIRQENLGTQKFIQGQQSGDVIQTQPVAGTLSAQDQAAKEQAEREQAAAMQQQISNAGSAAGAGYIAGQQAAGTTATTAAGTTGASSAAPATAGVLEGSTAAAVIPAAGAAVGTYLVAKEAKNLMEGKTDNSTAGKAGRAQMAITSGGLSEIGRGVKKAFFGGDHPDVEMRKDVRGFLRENSNIYSKDKKELVNLADGRTFDIGDSPDKSYNIDWEMVKNNKQAADVVPIMNMIATSYGLGPVGSKIHSDFVGEFWNAAVRGGGNIYDNVLAMIQNANFDKDSIFKEMEVFERKGLFTEDQRIAAQNALQSLYTAKEEAAKNPPAPTASGTIPAAAEVLPITKV